MIYFICDKLNLEINLELLVLILLEFIFYLMYKYHIKYYISLGVVKLYNNVTYINTQ